ncbi:PD40 domain-containing protein [Flammeovirga agarivorans]|uniref:WD40-like Beta Propeller Repeat n=1 Tax=Flammeovirga agarivorans TaxID=2726742 RepID=A0A7X8SPX1_9BACT|nr:PD40 domain-containing protein [Flammeovirga agarivorans]NLR94211.1 hypothetical protein [Flammeovirga agarivorans]
MKKILILFTLLISSFLLQAQNIVDSTNHVVDLGQKDMSLVRDLVRLGDSLFYQLHQPDEAFKYYFGAYDYISEEPGINKKIGECYLASITEEKSDGITYLKKALAIEGDTASSDLYFNIATTLHYNALFDEATEYYEKSIKGSDKVEVIEKRIKECIFGKEFYSSPKQHVIIKNLGPLVNSKYADFCPLVDAVEDDLYFTTRRHEFRTDNPDIQTHLWENIYHSHRKDYSHWSSPVPLPNPVNHDHHTATVSISMDGSEMILFRSGDLYISYSQQDTIWSKPKKLPNQINSIFVETSACLNYQMDTLYFVSNDEFSTIGGLDIYMSIKDRNGKWGTARNLGAMINTPYDEEGVALSRDGNTLYFSSRGHDTMGGYDVFKSTKDFQGNWSTPENLGYPINSPYDDVYFMIRSNGRHAYYSSSRQGGYGEKDIYRISILDEDKPLSLDRKEIDFLLLNKDSLQHKKHPTHVDHLKEVKQQTLDATTDLLKTLMLHAQLSSKDSVNQIE